jgi:hypothetical protein
MELDSEATFFMSLLHEKRVQAIPGTCRAQSCVLWAAPNSQKSCGRLYFCTQTLYLLAPAEPRRTAQPEQAQAFRQICLMPYHSPQVPGSERRSYPVCDRRGTGLALVFKNMGRSLIFDGLPGGVTWMCRCTWTFKACEAPSILLFVHGFD